MRLLVTHDPLDAAALADRLLILEAGHVVQTGTFADVSARPRSGYVAELVGVNLLTGVGHDDRVELPNRATIVVPGAGTGEVMVVIHPHAVALHRQRTEGSPRNVARGVVESIEPLGDRTPRPDRRAGAADRRDHARRGARPRPARGHRGLDRGQGDRRDGLPAVNIEAI